MAEHTVANVPHTQTPHSGHPAPAAKLKPGRRRPSSGRLGRLIVWEWAVVLGLLSGLGIALTIMSRGPDPRHEADAVVAQMKAALTGRPLGEALFDSYPMVSGAGRETMVTMSGVPPKVCVLVSWDLYRLGTVTVNGVTPQRVSAAKLVDLCNDATPATIIWTPKSGN